MTEREKVIKKAMDVWGLKLSTGDIVISFWELAGNLNDCWHAKLFVKKDNPCILIEKYNNSWALKNCSLYYMRRSISQTVSKIKDMEIIKQRGSIVFYLWRKATYQKLRKKILREMVIENK